MVEYKCNVCNKIFTRKPDYNRHINRKIPCKSDDVIYNQNTTKSNQNTTKLITKIAFQHPLFQFVFEKKIDNFQYPNTK